MGNEKANLKKAQGQRGSGKNREIRSDATKTKEEYQGDTRGRGLPVHMSFPRDTEEGSEGKCQSH